MNIKKKLVNVFIATTLLMNHKLQMLLLTITIKTNVLGMYLKNVRVSVKLYQMVGVMQSTGTVKLKKPDIV